MSYEIKKELIPGLPKEPFRHGAGAYEGVAEHSTDTPGASDENESRYFHTNWRTRQAFPHFVVDWDSITQLADINYQAWGAGQKANPRYVHIELCETSDQGKFQESYHRYVWLTSYLSKQRNLGVTDGVTLVSHDWISKHLGGTNHSDPIAYLASHGISWTQHVANVKAAYHSYTNSPQQSPQKSPPAHTSPPAQNSVPYPGHLIKLGSKGKDVVGVTADGIFGPVTEGAVKRYQRRHGLTADGIVGSKTWSVMFR
jgi:N-acetylmuramoyl-L-alanine amidase CwlA